MNKGIEGLKREMEILKQDRENRIEESVRAMKSKQEAQSFNNVPPIDCNQEHLNPEIRSALKKLLEEELRR